MLKIFLALAVTASALAQTQTAPAPAAQPDANAQQARQILDKCIKALGGDAYLNIRNIKQTGRGYGFHHNEAAGVGTLFTRYYQYPDKERYDIDKDWYIIHTGDKGYETTFRGTAEEDPKELAIYVRRHKFALDLILREWLKQSGTALFYDGPTMTDNKEVEKVTIVNSSNESVSLFINSRSFLPVRKSYRYRDPLDEQMSEESEVYDAYRPVQGVMTPFNVTRIKNDEMNSQRFYRDIIYNSALPESLFIPGPVNYNPKKKR
jgi:hypothetical protein